MKIAVTGFPGGLVRDKLVSLGVEPLDVDILDEDTLNGTIQTVLPDVVIHAASMTDVDACELDYKKAFQTNVRGTMYVAEACNRVNARMVYLSTCHVFDGAKNIKESYLETSRTNPKNVYGFTKWTGEVITHSTADKFLIVRISKLIHSEQFKKYLYTKDAIELPNFMWRNYTHIDIFSELLLQVITKPFYGNKFILNLGSADSIDSHLLISGVFAKLWLDTRLVRYRDYELPNLVFRPHNGSLDMRLAINSGIDLPYVSHSIDLVAKELQI